jgi:hypothetical protein
VKVPPPFVEYHSLPFTGS